MVRFEDSAFKHGWNQTDYFELLESNPMIYRSTRGWKHVYEMLGQNTAGDYLHVAFRNTNDGPLVFHMRRMSDREKRLYRRHR